MNDSQPCPMPVPSHDNTVSLENVAAYLNASPQCNVLAYDDIRPTSFDRMGPVRLDAMAIVLCTSGGGKVAVDLNEYELKAGSLFVLQPQNYLTKIETSPDFRANTVIVSLTTLQKIIPRLSDIAPSLVQHRLHPIIQLTEEEAESIKAFYRFIKLKLDGPQTHFLEPKVLNILQAALYEIMDLSLKHSDADNILHNRRREIMARFILKVTEDFRSERQVAYYAKQLCITPKHLSTVVKEISGRTAGEWIDTYVMMEAKMLLHTTDLTIQEIAARLCFSNQSFFGKYFKHHAGLSPSAYRECRQ